MPAPQGFSSRKPKSTMCNAGVAILLVLLCPGVCCNDHSSADFAAGSAKHRLRCGQPGAYQHCSPHSSLLHVSFVGSDEQWAHTFNSTRRGLVHMYIRCITVNAKSLPKLKLDPDSIARVQQNKNSSTTFVRAVLFVEPLDVRDHQHVELPFRQPIQPFWAPSVTLTLPNSTQMAFIPLVGGGTETPIGLYASFTNTFNPWDEVQVRINSWPQHFGFPLTACKLDEDDALSKSSSGSSSSSSKVGATATGSDGSDGLQKDKKADKTSQEAEDVHDPIMAANSSAVAGVKFRRSKIKIVVNKPHSQQTSVLSQVLLYHMAYHLCLGIGTYELYATPAQAAGIMQDPYIAGAVQTGALAIECFDDLATYNKFPISYQTLLYSLSIMRHWGTDVQLLFIDLDEYLSVPKPDVNVLASSTSAITVIQRYNMFCKEGCPPHTRFGNSSRHFIQGFTHHVKNVAGPKVMVDPTFMSIMHVHSGVHVGSETRWMDIADVYIAHLYSFFRKGVPNPNPLDGKEIDQQQSTVSGRCLDIGFATQFLQGLEAQ